MNWGYAARLGTMSGALALSACMMPYDGGGYDAPPPPAYSDIESPDLYAAIDRADSLWEAIGDAPPDHAFAFEGAEPWAWELQDGNRVVVEETADGIQSYYFAPGDAGPFLAVRPGMSFGFEGEAVAVVYGPDGGAMPREAGAEHLGEGAELYARGRRLLRAMLPRQWREVDSQAWIDTGPIIWGSVALWDEGRRRHPGWGHHRDGVRDAEWRRRLTVERLRRRMLAERFRNWREGGFQGPPPGRFHRPGAGHGPGIGRPGRPDTPGAGRPGIDRPRQPGQGGRPPGAQPGRPRQPDAGQPGSRPWRGGWRPNRPNPPAAGSPDTPAATPTVPGAERPRRPGWGGRPRPERGDAERSGTGRPQSAPIVDRPEGARPPRPEGPRRGWFRPRPEADGATPAPATRPSAGGGRPERAWSRPERSAPPASSPPRTSSPPAEPRASPPPRSSDGGVRERRVPDPDKRL
ncbi:hypothetical protein [Sphingomonas psychrotolerans]|uniref:Uncharacterized protein n=1 Tax=Sphingomonas psychrotolerans TaxID=1327635 RepID=A0A2K8MPU0_9SPHN|nr:hypothetical protein [Sphingomonas psychrotolerans]ATY33989.1 hypothetical protein CVN68_20220 [Sphingomonas psychrotolerans]